MKGAERRLLNNKLFLNYDYIYEVTFFFPVATLNCRIYFTNDLLSCRSQHWLVTNKDATINQTQDSTQIPIMGSKYNIWLSFGQTRKVYFPLTSILETKRPCLTMRLISFFHSLHCKRETESLEMSLKQKNQYV